MWLFLCLRDLHPTQKTYPKWTSAFVSALTLVTRWTSTVAPVKEPCSALTHAAHRVPVRPLRSSSPPAGVQTTTNRKGLELLG